MTADPPETSPHAPDGDGSTDQRVAAVLQVLRGGPIADVARRWSVEPALLQRWVSAFVDAGTAQVTNRPDQAAANQRDRFLAAFAHELRTPLGIAQGWSTRAADSRSRMSGIRSAGTTLLLSIVARLSERTLDVELLAASSLGRLVITPRLVSIGSASRTTRSSTHGHDRS